MGSHKDWSSQYWKCLDQENLEDQSGLYREIICIED